jgi:hypothetical protein
MQPFLLAFVDSSAFKLLSAAFLLPFVLLGAVVVWLLVVLTRSGVRDARRLRSPAVPATGWQHLGVAARLVPAALIGLVVLLVVLSEASDASEQGHATTAYQGALHHKELRKQAQVAGRYMLDDPESLPPNPAGDGAAPGWVLADTLRRAAGPPRPARPPSVELWLWPDGTFAYYSTLAGDKAGAQAIGRWRLHGDNWEGPATVAGLKKMRRYNVTFEFLLPIVEDPIPLSGVVEDGEDTSTTTLIGNYAREGQRQEPFTLKQDPFSLAPLPPPPAGMRLAFSVF